jgi:excisionase family DNA binding protein
VTAPEARPGDTVTLQLPRAAARQLERVLALGLLAESRATGTRPSGQAERLLRELHNATQPRPGFATETPSAAPATVDHGFAVRMLSTTEVAAVLGCSVQYARRLAQSGRLRAHRVGANWAIDPTDLDAYRYGRQEDTSGEPRPEAEQS